MFLSFLLVRQPLNNHSNDYSGIASAPQPEPEPQPEDFHEVPKDSTLTEISDGPPRYHGLFPTGYVPVLSDEGLPPPPTYEESIGS